MRRTRITDLFGTLMIGCALLGGALLPSRAQAQTEIEIVGDDWPPFNTDPASPHPGFMVEITKRILEPQGYRVKYSLLPWARAVAAVENGRADGLIGAARVDLESGVFPDEPIGILVNDFILLRDHSWDYHGVESLKGVTLGVMLDYTYGKDRFGTNLDEYISAHVGKGVEQISGEKPLESAVELLRRKRINVLIENKSTFLTALSSLSISPEEFRFISDVTEPQELFVGFGNHSAAGSRCAQLLTQGMRDLRKSGELQKILAAYGVSDWR